MNNYLDKLNQIANELLKGGENQDDVINRDSSRSSTSVRSTVSYQRRQNINPNVKEELKVIKVDAAMEDLDKIEADVKLSDGAKILRALKVLLKFLSTMRSNQLLTEKDKVTIQESNKKRNEEREAQTKK